MKIMKKIFSQKVIIPFAVMMLIISLYSCSENPVVPPIEDPIQLDTSDHYDWTLQYINMYGVWNCFVADSNNIYFDADPYPFKYDGEQYIQIDPGIPSFISSRVAGYDKDNIFIGGGRRGVPNEPAPYLVKITNGNLNTYKIDDHGRRIVDIYVEGADNAWISTLEDYRVYHYENGFLKTYILDSGVTGVKFYKDLQWNLYSFGYKSISYDMGISYIYKFYNNSFHLINTDTITTDYGVRRVGEYLIRIGTETIYYFSNEKWVRICDAERSILHINGTDINNLMIYGNQYKVHFWNGSYWRMEKNPLIPGDLSFASSFIKDDILYFFKPDDSGTLFLKGYPKSTSPSHLSSSILHFTSTISRLTWTVQ